MLPTAEQEATAQRCVRLPALSDARIAAKTFLGILPHRDQKRTEKKAFILATFPIAVFPAENETEFANKYYSGTKLEKEVKDVISAMVSRVVWGSCPAKPYTASVER